MGLFFRPRRPLMRLAAGAATAAVAYNAGRNRSEREQYEEQAPNGYAPPPQQYAPPPAPAPPHGDAALEQLERLAELHRSGAINDAEYAAMKSRVIGV